MKIVTKILAVTLSLTLAHVSYGQETKPSDKTDRKEIMQKHRAEVKAIKENTSLTEDEKKTLIKEKREALNLDRRGKRIGIEKGMGKNKSKGKFNSEEDRAAWKENREANRKEIEVIKNDSTLTEEEKEKLIKEKRAALPKTRKGKKKGRMEKGKVQSILDNPELTEAEKKEKIKALRTNKKGNKKKGKRKKMMDKMDGDTFAPERKEKAIKQLDKQEKNLQKALEKGKITQEQFDKRLFKIREVKRKLES